MNSEDIKRVLEIANGKPVRFVSANLTLFCTNNKYESVFADYDNQRMVILRPHNDGTEDTMFPFEMTYVMFDQIETATILLTMEDAEEYLKTNENNLIYKESKNADACIKEIRESPAMHNFNPVPYTSPYSHKREDRKEIIIKA